MNVEGITPILNVSNIHESFAWFEKLGWERRWEWGERPDFGSVGSGKYEIFLCRDGQGSRGGPMPTFSGDENTGSVWMTWWVSSPAEVDAIHSLALENGMIVTGHPPMRTGTFANSTSVTPTDTPSGLARVSVKKKKNKGMESSFSLLLGSERSGKQAKA